MFTRWSETKNGKFETEPLLAHLPEMEAVAAGPAGVIGHASKTAMPELAGPPPIPSRTRTPLQPVDARHVSDAEVNSVIGEDLTIEGQSITIRCRGALQINGNIQAELHSKTLVVGDSGKVEGSIWADTVDVRGRVSGTIMGSRVVLHPSAQVEGDIHAKSLSVSDGATFEGRSRRVTDSASIAPRLDGSAAVTNSASAHPTQMPIPPSFPKIGDATT